MQEEIAAVNLAKYRKLQHDLEESEARAEMAENVVGQMRSKGRTSAVTETTSVSTQYMHTVYIHYSSRSNSSYSVWITFRIDLITGYAIYK